MDLAAIEDEQIVNTALLLFLIAVTIHDPEVKGYWSLSRQQFRVSNQTSGPRAKKVYEAWVDGVLRKRGSNEVKAIVEVKPYLRVPNIVAIRMQEAAQMAAWMCTSPPTTSRSCVVRTRRRRTLAGPLPVCYPFLTHTLLRVAVFSSPKIEMRST